MFHHSTAIESTPADRILRLLMVTLLAMIPILSVSAMTAAPAGATTTVSTSIDPANGFPSWYEDAVGTRVVPCLDPTDANCVLAGFTSTGPVAFPTNFPGEFFYTIADSDRITANGCKGTKRGTVSIRFALEGTFGNANGTPEAGQQIVFARVRIRVTSGLCANTAYRFVHPFGTTTLTTDSAGAIAANAGTVDVGCGAAPCAFGSPLLSPIFGSAAVAGSGFLRWDPSVAPAAPAGYLGDGATPHRVVGGTNGNLFKVQDNAGVDVPGLATNLFSVSGKVAGSLVAAPSSVDFGGQPVDTTSSVRTVTVTNLDSAEVTLSAPILAGASGFAITGGSCAEGTRLARDATCTVDLTFSPAGTLDARSDTLTIASTGGVRSPLTVALRGTAVEPTMAPVLTPNTTTLAFGNTRVREASRPERLTITNSGDAPLSITDVRLDPAASAEANANFRIIGDTCSAGAAGTTVDPGKTCDIDVQFAPLSNGDHATRILLSSNAGPAAADLTGSGTGGTAAVGPVGAFGFPEWYRDDTGIKVGQCIDPADPYCIVLPDGFYDPTKALLFPDNFPEEFFYQVADTETDIADPTCSAAPARVRMRSAVEAAFANGGPVEGDQMTFGRIRFSANGGLCPDTDYYFTSPYGSDLFTSDASGVLKPAAGTQDIGCVPTPGTPCDWELALSSRVLSSLVRWDPDVAPAAPAGYLGDAATLHTIVGAPYLPDGATPANYFRVTRADTGQEIAFIDEFTVMGKLQGPLEAMPSTVDLGAVPTGSTSEPIPFTLANTGLDTITIAAGSAFAITGPSAADFAVDPGTCPDAVMAPADTCAGTVTFTPAADGPREAHLAVPHDGLNNPVQIRLVGVGQALAAAFSTTPTSVTFGPTHLGQPSEVETVTISNIGGLAPLSVSAVELVGPAAPQYGIVGNTCLVGGTPVAVPVDGSCAVDVVFTPTEAGASQVSLQFTDNATGSPQSVALTGTGSSDVPVDSALIHPDNGFPMYYRDGNGVRVEPCIDPDDPLCVLAGFDAGGAAVDFPGNFPDEFFYSIADSSTVAVAPIPDCTVTSPGSADLRIALEGAFANTGPVAGDQIVFGRTRILATGLCPGTSYTFVTPYGPQTVAADEAGDVKSTDDIGTTPFSGALASPIAGSFPRWNPNVLPAAPAGYLGDPVTPHTIVGGTYVPVGAPGAFNGFEIRAGAGDVLGSTDQFLVSGKLASSLHSTSTALDFGNVNISVKSAAQTVTLTNTGPPVSIAAPAVQPDPNTAASEFVLGGTCQADLTLTTDETCTVTAQFAPVAPIGGKSAAMTVTPSSGPPVVITMTGTADSTGLPVAGISPSSLAFGSVNVGIPSTQSVFVTNTGSADLHVGIPTITGAAAGDYTITFNNCAIVTPGGPACRMAVAFTPSGAGTRSAALTFTHDAAGSPTVVPLTGTGVASRFSVTPTSVKFGKVGLNTRKTGSVTVKNTGTIPVTPTAAGISGTGAAMFSVLASPNCMGVPLAPGRSCSINIGFTPTATGNHTATLTVTGDTSSIPKSVSVTMTGTGR